MNEQLQAKLVEILAGIQSATKAAGDFALEQLPSIAQQYVIFGRALTSAWILAGIAALIGSFFLIRSGMRASKLRSEAGLEYSFQTRPGVPGEAALVIGYLGGLLAAFFGVVITTCNLSPFLMVWFAPKVWLLKEIASLIK